MTEPMTELEKLKKEYGKTLRKAVTLCHRIYKAEPNYEPPGEIVMRNPDFKEDG